MRCQVVGLAACAVAACLGHEVMAARFQGLGNLPEGSHHPSVNGVSANGLVVVGSVAPTSSDGVAFRWTEADGTVAIEGLGSNGSEARAVSADGSIVVGTSTTGPTQGHREGFRWSESDGITWLGVLADLAAPAVSSVLDVSAEGLVIVGESNTSAAHSDRAFRWTAEDGMVDLGLIEGGLSATATGVSANGQVVAGVVASESGNEAFRWTEEDDMVPLGDLPGGTLNSAAYSISADGTTVVGYGVTDLGSEAFIWTEEDGMVGIGDLPGGRIQGVALGVSADGSVVVGKGEPANTSQAAFIWDAEHGMRNLQDVLTNDLDLDLSGWHLRRATGVSDDGLVIVGEGLDPTGQATGWIAYLGEFLGDMDVDGEVDFDDIAPFVLGLNNATQYFATFGVPPAVHGDIDESGFMDFDDIDGFVGILVGRDDVASIEAVPEISSVVLAAIAVLGLTVWPMKRVCPSRTGR